MRAGRVSTKITSGRSANAARKKPDVVVDIVSDSDSEELCLSSGPAKVARRPHGGAHTAEAPVTAQSQPRPYSLWIPILRRRYSELSLCYPPRFCQHPSSSQAPSPGAEPD